MMPRCRDFSHLTRGYTLRSEMMYTVLDARTGNWENVNTVFRIRVIQYFNSLFSDASSEWKEDDNVASIMKM